MTKWKDGDPRTLARKLGAVPVLSALRPEERELFIRKAEYVRFPRNTLVIEQGERTTALYVVLSGRVRIYLTGDDEMFDRPKEVSLSIEGEGSYFGEISLLDLEPRTASVKTLEETCCLVISRDALTATILQNPEVALSLIQGITKRFRSTIDNVKRLAFSSVYKRVVTLLMEMAVKDGRQWIIRQRPTHQELADMVGASRVMVSRILKGLTLGNYITVARGHIIIHRKLPEQF